MKTWNVIATNLHGNEVRQKIQAYSADQAKFIVLKRNKYLTVTSVELAA